MNYYERVQRAIDFIEVNLNESLLLEDVSKSAFMSMTNLYRMFFAMTGYQVKEYIRNRRFSEAAREISLGSTVLDAAIKYGFESHEAFSRSFRKVTGVTPSSLKRNGRAYLFERMNIMDKYFEIQDEKLLEKYPDIKVLKELQPMRVAYYRYYGRGPETGAWNVISDWLRNSGLSIEKDGLRFFGFNNPSPSPGQQEYGYEIWAVIGENIAVSDGRIGVKTVEGGLYAVTSVKGGPENIFPTWQRFKSWLEESKYAYGGHQWLEEHLNFDDDFSHLGGIDLYMPIELKKQDIQKDFVDVKPVKLACMRFEGFGAVDEARKAFTKWLEEGKMLKDDNTVKVRAWYNHERIGMPDHYCEIGIPVEEGFKTQDKRIKLVDFTGGHYALVKSKFKRLGFEWSAFIKWVQKSTEYGFAPNQFFEEYHLLGGGLEMDTEVFLYMPVPAKSQG